MWRRLIRRTHRADDGLGMKTFFAALLGCAHALVASAQQEFEPAEIIRGANDWLAENIDDDVLDTLGVDKDRVHKFLGDLQRQFQGPYVYDLSAWRETARQIEPLLASHEETQPYAAWLRAHLDDFAVAEALKKDAVTNAVDPARLPPPSATAERKVWVEVIEKRPVPPAAAKHLARLKEIFREEKVPTELVWVAEVESSFDARARSPAGAAGMFQLMPATARDLNLSVGVLRDERLNPEKSARAAAKHLRRLYGKFGDWRLAFAAYNAGEGRIAELMKKHNARTFDGIRPYLPSETQLYVPKLEATLRKREGVTLAQLKLPNG
jgi:membrane-bound lytic murein transglycosylase D